MIKFIGKSLLLIFLVLLTNLLFVGLFPSSFSKHFKATVAKHRILESTNSPKIVFVGGSNLAFGLDSEQVQKKLGLPVINMGLHAALGLRYMLEEVRPHLGPGDIVVIVPEYAQFYGLLNGKSTLVRLLTVYPRGLRYVNSPGQIISLLEFTPDFLRTELKLKLKDLTKPPDPTYFEQSFNEYGDATGHLSQDPRTLQIEELSEPKSIIPVDSAAISILNKFYAESKKKGIVVVLLYPSLADTAYKNDQKNIEALHQQLRESLEMPILALPLEYVYPIEYFFDTAYHLHVEGRKTRTEQVISDLADHLRLDVAASPRSMSH